MDPPHCSGPDCKQNCPYQQYPVSLLAGLQDLRNADNFSDITIRVGEKTFKGHRVVLAASSPYFRAMFTGGLSETNKKEVKIETIEAETFSLLLDFIYQGSITLTTDNCQEVLIAANLLQLTALMHKCIVFLSKKLDPSNVSDVINFAIALDMPVLHKTAEDMALSRFREVFWRTEFLTLSEKTVIEIFKSENIAVCHESESSDQPAPGPVPGVSTGVSNFGMTLDCDESTAEVSSSVMAHASPPGEELPQWRKYTATRTRPVCSDYGGLEDGSLEDVSLSDIQILSNNSILLSYWKISCRLRTTSIVLQRWLMAVIMFIMLWNITYIIHWVSHQTTVLGIAQFVIPLLLLPIICSAYAEVNMEGRRMLKSICPTPGRMDMLFYLAQQPLEVTAFGFPINYSTIVKAMGAMVLAFCTRLILDEINM